MTSIQKQCKNEGCSKFASRKLMCDKHYMSWWYIERRHLRKSVPRHGLDTSSSEYRTWVEIRRRCYDPKRQEFKHYGARNIRVCDRWRHSYPNFLEDMGAKSSSKHSIERKDNDGDYEPSNCVWATAKEQANNRRSSHFITINGKTRTIQAWCDLYKIPDTTFHNRLRRGWVDDKLLRSGNRRHAVDI